MATDDPSEMTGTAIRTLAASAGLTLDDGPIRVNEMGLDFRVAIARDTAGQDWVLRIPRRPDATARARDEALTLRLVAPHLTPAVPDWRISRPDLIAYPLLSGEPGLTLDDDGTPVWHLDTASLRYARSLGDFLAELHGIDPAEAAGAGVRTRSPAEVRQAWRTDIDRVVAEFEVAPGLRDRWGAWLGEDSYWPQWSVLTHGEVYPAHTLVVDERITAVLDWTTAAVDDPARDFAFHHASAPPQAFAVTLQRYTERGGRVWPRLAEHCAELISASPVAYGVFALDTGTEEHRQAAAAQLNPAG
ncbi:MULTISPECIES: macrolide 2'-phosphotransferase [Citricoccus]|uniref:macrolide 2'-phosphotransferase n=1 Tax=Citricoccus TaxID=169133 RepID=UPI000255F01A|nr:macrolide 2'-phosphotransferase [Citricoccus sp. CH26A]